MRAAKLLIGSELALAVLSGVFAAVNIALTGPPATIVTFTVLAVASLVSAAIMASLLWLFNLPTDPVADTDDPAYDLAA